MARAVWKGPFVEESLMKKVDKYKDDPKKIPIKTWSRKSTTLPRTSTQTRRTGRSSSQRRRRG